jgi:hypothetical protein
MYMKNGSSATIVATPMKGNRPIINGLPLTWSCGRGGGTVSGEDGGKECGVHGTPLMTWSVPLDSVRCAKSLIQRARCAGEGAWAREGFDHQGVCWAVAQPPRTHKPINASMVATIRCPDLRGAVDFPSKGSNFAMAISILAVLGLWRSFSDVQSQE